MIEKFRKRLEKENIENFIVAKSSNLFYLLRNYNLSGFLVFRPEETTLITSKFYNYALDNLEIDYKIYSSREEREKIFNDLSFKGEVYSDSPEVFEDYFKAEKSEVIKDMRERKTEEEVKRIKKASRVSVEAMKNLRKNLQPSKTEWELASTADRKIRSSGCYNAFETLVHSKTLEPHRSPEDKEIGDSLVLVDLGAKYKGHCSDMTRTFCIDPSREQKELYNDVLDIYNRVFRKIKPGKEFSEITSYAESLAEEKGYSLKKNFLHRIGHSLGVDIHESPGFSHDEDSSIGKGMIFTLEPGLYVPDIGGVRIEDTIFIRKDGEKEVLTKFPKEL